MSVSAVAGRSNSAVAVGSSFATSASRLATAASRVGPQPSNVTSHRASGVTVEPDCNRDPAFAQELGDILEEWAAVASLFKPPRGCGKRLRLRLDAHGK